MSLLLLLAGQQSSVGVVGTEVDLTFGISSNAGTTAVFQNLDQRWDTHRRVATTIDLQHAINAVLSTVGGQVQFNYAVYFNATRELKLDHQLLSGIGTNLDVRANVRALATSSVDLRHHAAGPVVKALDVTWEIFDETMVVATLDVAWAHFNSYVGANLDATWALHNKSTQSVDLRHDLLRLQGKSVQAYWSTVAQTSNALDVEWGFGGLVSKSVDVAYSMRNVAGQVVDLQHTTTGRTIATVDLRHDQRILTAQLTDVRWEGFQHAAKTIDFRHDGSQYVSDSLSVDWATNTARYPVWNGLDVQWDSAHVLGHAVDLRHATQRAVINFIELNHNIAVTRTKGVELDWASFALSQANLDARWNAFNLLSLALDLRHNLHSFAIATTNVQWNAHQLCSKAQTTGWSMLQVAGAAQDMQWNTSELAGKSLDTRWEILLYTYAVARELQARWNAAHNVNTQADAQWNLHNKAGHDVDAVWSRAHAVPAEVEPVWALDQHVAADLFVEWSEFVNVGDELSIDFAMLLTAANALDLTWEQRYSIHKEVILELGAITGHIVVDIDMEWRKIVDDLTQVELYASFVAAKLQALSDSTTNLSATHEPAKLTGRAEIIR